MGTTGARHFRQIVANVEKILAVEALCAAQACDLRSIRPAGALGEVHAAIRRLVPHRADDLRIMADDIETARRGIHNGELDLITLAEGSR